MSVLANIKLKERGMLDCDDVFENLTHPQQLFLHGILSISIPLGRCPSPSPSPPSSLTTLPGSGGYGTYVLRAESIWACSVFGIDPPPELLQHSDAQSE